MKDISSALYEQRVIILMEDTETGVFKQVLINSEQFKKVSDSICTIEESDEPLREGYQMAKIEIGDKEWKADIFNGCSTICEEL